MTLVALDPGHGQKTPGKRSPDSLGLPILREYEFNRSVTWATEQALERCGISHMRTVADDSNPKLSVRAEAAERDGCKLFVSIHANAGGGTGIESYHYEHSDSGNRLSRLVLQSTLSETGMESRGQKMKITYKGRLVDPSVLVYASARGMAACLIECGFMDNVEDLAKLRTHEYKLACGEGIAQGICQYLGVPYVAPLANLSHFPDLSNSCAAT